MALGQKQSLPDQEAWESAWEHSHLLWPDDKLDRLIDRSAERVRRHTKGKTVAYGWSGGKDSLALQTVMEAAGLPDCLLVISALEHPKFLRWATDWMPDQLTIIEKSNIDLDWLKAHPAQLFPQGAAASVWFRNVQHAGQREFFHAEGLDVLAVGRRWADGNYTGPGKGAIEYTNRQGVTRYSPIADWPHEAVLALLKRNEMTLPPTYDWPRGYQVGSGPWPARQWCRSNRHGWAEIHQIDTSVLDLAVAHDLPGARDYVASL